VLSKALVRDILARSFRESVRQGTEGGAHELKVFTSPWSFDFAEIKVPEKGGPVPALIAHLVPNWDWLKGVTVKVAIAHRYLFKSHRKITGKIRDFFNRSCNFYL